MASERSLSQAVAEFGVSTMESGAPPNVRTSAKQRILDILGLQAAALHLDTSGAALRFVAAQGCKPSAHVVGTSARTSPAWAAFANGVLAHSLDYDDTHMPSIVHPSATVVPAGLAAAQFHDVSGPAVLDAVAVGIEVVVRLAMAGYDHTTKDSAFFTHGQHATSICGAIGAAVTASLIGGATREAVTDAIGVATSMASGIIEANRTGGTVKRLHCGWAAHAGLTAADLVDVGFTGPSTALEGRFGFFEAFLHGAADQSQVTRELGQRWAVPDIAFKPYPANHFTHTGFDAASRLRERGLQADDIAEAVLGVAPSTVRTIGEPLELKQRPETGYQAQFSGPYMVALGLLGGSGLGAGLADFTDEVAQEPRRRALMSRIRVEPNETCATIYPYEFPAVLWVRTHRGEEFTEEALVNRGGRQNPLSEVELHQKFRDNVGVAYPPEVAGRVEQALDDLSRGAHGVTEVLAPLGQPH